MRGTDHVFDKILLATGLILLVWCWAHFPVMPAPDNHHYASYASTASKWTYLKPARELSPREVIRIQLQALQQNDGSDSGIITVYNFSSPTNKLAIGPINHFRMLVRDPAYQPMLNFKSYKTGQLVVTDNTAYQLVVITGQQGQEEVYLFILSKQRRGAYKGCWMTEGVARMEPGRESKLI